MAFKYEKVTDDVTRAKIEERLRVLEERRIDVELDELSPSTSPNPLGGIRGVFDPATGATIGAAATNADALKQIDAEIAALRQKRDALPKPTTTPAAR